MKILSMTATFGKLSHQTLTLEQGLNIIDAPNEWGKSTWCAFIMAMLYGIDTGSRSKTGFLADKEHYSPWSGAPMSGRMDILWNGREITLERQAKGRVPFGEVKAYETHTGVPVPELAVATPGQVLLGVERSVFSRAGFLRLSEMPVTEDESLRRRLNELVTTGDESGASDDLAQKLRDLKNKCRFNKKGLLPEMEAKQAELEQKLQQLQSIQTQMASIQQRQAALEEQHRLLENHKQALAYSEHLRYAQKLAMAQVNRDVAQQSVTQARQACDKLPQPEIIQQNLTQLQQLRDNRDALHTQAQLLPPLPQAPQAPEIFRGKDPEQAVTHAQQDAVEFARLQKALKKPFALVIGCLLVVLGIALFLFGKTLPMQAGAGVALLCGIVGILFFGLTQRKLKQQIIDLQKQYAGVSAENWESAAAAYANTQRSYSATLQTRQQELGNLNQQMEENNAAIGQIIGEMSLAQFEETCRSQLQMHNQLREHQRVLEQAEDVLQALSGAGQQVTPPQFADTLELSAQDTEKQLSDNVLERQLLHQRLGQCQGQMDAFGSEAALLSEKEQVQSRIARLEQYYGALSRAQETLTLATQELQRRFAPRISGRAQELFARMTNQRYQRLTLCQDLSVEAGAEGENTLRGTLWRSDGTVDQLYLALRLAVAEELTPDAPIVLDDALVRFDDTRLASALKILREESESKQVILFTCQSRERELANQEE